MNMDKETKQLTKRRNIDSHTSSRSAGKGGADHIKTHSAYKVLAKLFHFLILIIFF